MWFHLNIFLSFPLNQFQKENQIQKDSKGLRQTMAQHLATRELLFFLGQAVSACEKGSSWLSATALLHLEEGAGFAADWP